MNKAITEGVVFMPTPFASGLDEWSSQNGRPGDDTYENAANAAFVPADQDFGGCLELQKTASTQKLRYMGETPLLPGCYIRVRARVKAISGNLPNVRIAGYPAQANGTEVGGLTVFGPQVSLNTYGDVTEVSAILGAGNRGGVDMVWGTTPVFAHLGLDLTGSNGGVVRIDDLVIEDITSAFLADMLATVDVRDFGAIGDGTTNDSAAFEAADDAADGREIVVSDGTYRLNSDVTINSRIRFEGTVTMPDSAILSLTQNFDLGTYIDAFGNEETGFKKAFQSLLNNSDHESLDMGGRRISISGPMDMQAVVNNKNSYAQRRHIANGQFYATGDTVWEPEVRTSAATYSASDDDKLTNVGNIANIPVGSLITGVGVGREVYVRSVNIAAQEITLSQPLGAATGSQTFTFTRFKYMLDFSGFEQLTSLSFSDVEFQCNNKASAIMLAKTGTVFQVRDCYFTRPKYRGITSIGYGCQGMLVDRCQFLSSEGGIAAQNRVSIAINANANDVKLRNNRASQFRHFCILSGSNSVVSGNHFFQGDGQPNGVRMAGLVLALRSCNATVVGNYVDNCFIEWTNEREVEPDYVGGFGFAGLSITNNVFLCGDVLDSFAWIVVKPYGSGHRLNGLNVNGNLFRGVGTVIRQAERIDTSHNDMDYGNMKNVYFSNNTFNNVLKVTENPVVVSHTQATEATTWQIPGADILAFGGEARGVDAVVATDKISNSSNVAQWNMPYVKHGQGTNNKRVDLFWPTAVKGKVNVTMRMDV
ncbi:glycosyl hydrolase family 28-related protein [Marinovum sp. 2_MG-2023]|uniref:glycosyl hydrolase family 28-related protein n=1 Tax=unclassified Marinovum TaxID=2647166 RepID=UPI0026E20697|nr:MULTISPECIES: glycosyl hydrolase family 28-related protein [unclassified Marinovum]MDO6730801.1 glycosyl hydrolase family 28-related protein [Marinovum sp. 2_MG-2023]MDO6779994.1 glycosyl hydrolase family 28-related protein [Marinovum sp. 1_MG-2023]